MRHMLAAPILVIGATGNVGRRLAAELTAQDAAVRAMVRAPASARLPAQTEIVRGDLTAPESIDSCIQGVHTVFLLWQAPGTTVAEVIGRMARQVRRIVFLSNQTVRDDREVQEYAVSSLHAEIERAIAASGVEWTFLRPGAFAANARLWWARQIRSGDVVRWPFARAHTAPVHEADIAAVAVRALVETGHAGAKYLLTGPQSLTQQEQVEILAKALGRPLRFEEMPEETALTELSDLLSPAIATMLMDAWRRRVDEPEIVTATVAEITGAPARSFHQWASDHAADFASES